MQSLPTTLSGRALRVVRRACELLGLTLEGSAGEAQVMLDSNRVPGRDTKVKVMSRGLVAEVSYTASSGEDDDSLALCGLELIPRISAGSVETEIKRLKAFLGEEVEFIPQPVLGKPTVDLSFYLGFSSFDADFPPEISRELMKADFSVEKLRRWKERVQPEHYREVMFGLAPTDLLGLDPND